MLDHIGQIRVRIDAVELACTNCVHGGSPLSAAAGTNEEVIFPTKCNAAQRAFRNIIVYFSNAIIIVMIPRSANASKRK